MKNILNEYAVNKPALTFILGSKCSNGVVLVADRKITASDHSGMYFDYRDKLFTEIQHVIFGSSGSTGNYEQFRGRVKNHIRTNTVLVDDIILVLSDHAYSLNERYKYRNETIFDVLVGIAYADRDSTLTYISAYGLPTTIPRYQAIGVGARYAKAFMEKAWNSEMTMEQVAELGYFVIRYIEKFRLDLSVGLDKTRPQVWYIPNRYEENEQHIVVQNNDRLATDVELEQMAVRVEKRLLKHEKHLIKLFEE